MKTFLLFGVLIFSQHAFSQFEMPPDTTKSERFTIHMQTTVINQFKPGFTAPYSGDNSLSTSREDQTSLTSTLFLGAKLWKGASVFLNPEIAGGSGLSSALGIAAATNGETFRIGNPSPKIYVARAFFQQIFALTDKKKPRNQQYFHNHSDFNQLEEDEPLRYFSIIAGKISVADYFDDNSYSHDPRTQFMSWALMDNGAWDYPANTRGYAPSVVLQYVNEKWELHYGLSLVPKTANGNVMNWNLPKSYSNTLEFTRKYKVKGKFGAVRLLTYLTSTQMGNYAQAILQQAQNPDIVSTRAYGRLKYGFGLNAEQDLGKGLGWFGRLGWNDGHNETWVFTEIDRSFSTGLILKGSSWKRPTDVVGFAYALSGISKWHREYLAAGGKGFMLGDGRLNYGLENLSELFYTCELVKDHLYVTGTYQLLLNPGYNRDRSGPVNVFSLRVHGRF